MTLIELVVSIAVVGLIAVVLAAAITVVFRQAPATASSTIAASSIP